MEVGRGMNATKQKGEDGMKLDGWLQLADMWWNVVVVVVVMAGVGEQARR